MRLRYPLVSARCENAAARSKIKVPQIEGMTPSFDAVVSPEDGMPGQDLEVRVVYSSTAVPSEPEEQETTVEPQTTAEPQTTGGTEGLTNSGANFGGNDFD